MSILSENTPWQYKKRSTFPLHFQYYLAPPSFFLWCSVCLFFSGQLLPFCDSLSIIAIFSPVYSIRNSLYILWLIFLYYGWQITLHVLYLCLQLLTLFCLENALFPGKLLLHTGKLLFSPINSYFLFLQLTINIRKSQILRSKYELLRHFWYQLTLGFYK